jgi:hypothetical protein
MPTSDYANNKTGNLVLTVAFGGGLSFGANLVRMQARFRISPVSGVQRKRETSIPRETGITPSIARCAIPGSRAGHP